MSIYHNFVCNYLQKVSKSGEKKFPNSLNSFLTGLCQLFCFTEKSTYNVLALGVSIVQDTSNYEFSILKGTSCYICNTLIDSTLMDKYFLKFYF